MLCFCCLLWRHHLASSNSRLAKKNKAVNLFFTFLVWAVALLLGIGLTDNQILNAWGKVFNF